MREASVILARKISYFIGSRKKLIGLWRDLCLLWIAPLGCYLVEKDLKTALLKLGSKIKSLHSLHGHQEEEKMSGWENLIKGRRGVIAVRMEAPRKEIPSEVCLGRDQMLTPISLVSTVERLVTPLPSVTKGSQPDWKEEVAFQAPEKLQSLSS